MTKYFTLSLLILLLTGCATQHQSLTGIQTWNYPQHQIDKDVTFSFVDGLLEKTGNKHSAKWAKRKNIHVIGVKLINNTNKPIHGTQIALHTEQGKAEILHNLWLAKKTRQRVSPLMILALPALLVEQVLFHRNDDDYAEDSYTDYEPVYITTEVVEHESQKRASANFDLRKELMSFQLATQTLLPGKPVYGIVGIKTSDDLDGLKTVIQKNGIELFSADH